MTDRTQPEAGSTHIIRFALELGLLWIDGDGRDKVREALDALDALEAQLEAIGAGGVSGPLVGIAAPPTAQAEGWVSVEDRLPPVRTTVFIASGAGPSAWRTLAFYDPDRYTPAWRCNDDPSERIRGVSHWMHMPIPPSSAEGVEHG